MIFPVLQNNKHRLLLSHLSLALVLSSSFSDFLVASKNDPLIENEEKSLKRMRDNNNTEGEQPLEAERPLKRQKTKALSVLSTPLFVYDDPLKGLYLPHEIIPHFFASISFKDIRAGRCVSKLWKEILTDDEFCTSWGGHFAPSTPEAMGMKPKDFIRYWSTPSFTVLSDDDYKYVSFNAMSSDGSVLVGGTNDDPNTAVKWVDGEITPLPFLNNGTFANVHDVSSDGSIMVGSAEDGPDNGKFTAVQWSNGEIKPLPFLNNGTWTSVNGINGDGTIMVGSAGDGDNEGLSKAVQWSNGEIKTLPSLNNGNYSSVLRVNSDGSVMVGRAEDGANNGLSMAVQWINGEIEPLPLLNNGIYAEVNDVNSDGSILVGSGIDGANHNRYTAVQWVNGKVVPLPFLRNGAYASVHSVNSDGSVMVGKADDGAIGLSTAVQWINGEIFSIQELLESAGVNLGGYRLSSTFRISANGLQVIGSSDKDGFKAVLPSKYSQ